MAGWAAAAQAATQMATAFGTSAMAGAQMREGMAANEDLAIQQNTWRREDYKQQVADQRYNAQHAHQWEVADMRAAGLNPILSATGGNGASTSAVPNMAAPPHYDASAPHRAQGEVISRAGSAVGQAMSDAIMSFADQSLKLEQAKTQQAVSERETEQAKLLAAEQPLVTEKYKTEQTQQALNSAAAAKTLEDTNTSKANALAAVAQAHANNSLSGLNSAREAGEKIRNDISKIDLEVREAGRPIEKVTSAAEKVISAGAPLAGAVGFGALIRSFLANKLGGPLLPVLNKYVPQSLQGRHRDGSHKTFTGLPDTGNHLMPHQPKY